MDSGRDIDRNILIKKKLYSRTIHLPSLFSFWKRQRLATLFLYSWTKFSKLRKIHDPCSPFSSQLRVERKCWLPRVPHNIPRYRCPISYAPTRDIKGAVQSLYPSEFTARKNCAHILAAPSKKISNVHPHPARVFVPEDPAAGLE